LGGFAQEESMFQNILDKIKNLFGGKPLSHIGKIAKTNGRQDSI